MTFQEFGSCVSAIAFNCAASSPYFPNPQPFGFGTTGRIPFWYTVSDSSVWTRSHITLEALNIVFDYDEEQFISNESQSNNTNSYWNDPLVLPTAFKAGYDKYTNFADWHLLQLRECYEEQYPSEAPVEPADHQINNGYASASPFTNETLNKRKIYFIL